MKHTGNRARAVGALAFSTFVGLTAFAQAPVHLDKQVTIQPIIVRSNDGVSATANAGAELYAAETQKIWAQAGIEIKFNAFQYYDNTASLSLDVAGNPTLLTGLGQVTGQTWSTTSLTVIKLFFVQSLGAGVLGYTDQSGLQLDIHGNPNPIQSTAMAISDAAFSLNRIDVIAHELGHALGLGKLNHTFFVGDGQPYNLMADGGVRSSPTSIGDIFPDGANYDRLTGTIGGTAWGDDINSIDGGQIDRARRMTAVVANSNSNSYYYYSVPEPATAAAIAGVLTLVVTGLIRRRTQAQRRAQLAAA